MAARTRFLNPEGLASPPGYSHVTEIAGSGRIVHVAGQIAQDARGAIVGIGDFRAQAEQVFHNIGVALAAVGAGFEHVVKVNNYLVDLSHRPILREVRARHFPADRAPASTLVGVSALATPDILLEVEVVAFVPD